MVAAAAVAREQAPAKTSVEACEGVGLVAQSTERCPSILQRQYGGSAGRRSCVVRGASRIDANGPFARVRVVTVPGPVLYQ